MQAALRAADGRAHRRRRGGRVRMRMIGCFEGLDERGGAWRRADSYSLREFLRLSKVEKVPDHSWLSRALASARTRRTSGPSPMSSIAAACGLGCADGRISTSAA